MITLITQARAAGNIRDIHAFGTPTVVHFCTSLVISALMSAPWQTLAILSGCLAAAGVAGLAYSFRVFWHARKATYTPDVEDWVWYLGIPLIAHLALLCAAALIWWNLRSSLAIVATDAIVFLLLGVHNAWDTVTFIAVRHVKSSTPGETKDPIERTPM